MDIFDHIDAELLRISEIAPAGYLLALRVRGTAPLMAFKTYPQAWIDRYMEQGYLLRDPITTWAMTIGGTIRWSSSFLVDPFRILRQAAAHGLRYGASVAHGSLGALTICSAGRSDREMTDEEIARLRQIVVDLHNRTELPKSLTESQKAVLRAMAQGDSPRQAADRIGVSEAHARASFKQLCACLYAQSPAEAVQRARDYKLL